MSEDGIINTEVVVMKPKLNKKRMMFNMATKAGNQKEITFVRNEGAENEETVKYLLQHPGVRRGMQIQNSFFNEKTGKVDMNLKYEAMMEHLVRRGDTLQKTNWDYWEDCGVEEFNFVMGEASTFLSGKSAE